ncbi:MAG: hypothetical protein M3512_01530 [Bacteroidota bacterium]|nr:hypothetical protein [Bacteroidota bacterium]
MKRSRTFFTTALLSLGTLTMAFSNRTEDGPNNSEKVEVVTKDQGLYNLVYRTTSSGNYKVNIFNNKGEKVFTENFKSNMSFSKLFNFSKMEYGTYTMVILNGSSEKFKKEIVHQPTHSLKVDLSPFGEKGKFNLSVNGLNNKPVRVVILDKDYKELYNEVMDVESGFTRLFDLSRVASSHIKFQVVHNGQTVEKHISL